MRRLQPALLSKPLKAAAAVSEKETDLQWMRLALDLARHGAKKEEVPVGAVLVNEQDRVIGKAHNACIGLSDPTAHAEVLVLRQAASMLGNYRLPNTTLYVTLEPCVMCLGAMIQARIKRLVFAAWDLKQGAVKSTQNLLSPNVGFNHKIFWTEGLLEQDSQDILKSFFRHRRKSGCRE